MGKLIDEIYNYSIRNLSSNARVHAELSEEKMDKIIQEFNDKIDDAKASIEEKKNLLKKYFFILAHTNFTSKKVQPTLIKSFEIVRILKLDSDFIIFLLSAVQRQFIDHQSKSGDKIPFELFTKLKELLNHSNAEVLEWTLRTIEALGPQSLLFEKELLNLKPSLLKIFNQHQQNAFQVVEVIKSNWSRFKK